ncbi:SusC/RagA family TonB-linked outer membrane protein [Pedobacter montanisoli]|uniref:TonB-dependent receptor n=1 Tax=Pedobacter montanisoli TaxID=2923277 RepID=A0ABS9ZV10_9SPHI|nr:TonB-dependent receptor [Pedobacter montanisoli]MCJ0741894.1 TonB-dependent receptor [Pedobacter montanisoli]
MNKKLLMILLGVLVFVGQVVAQQVAITGKVTGAEDGLPIPGASIKIKGKSTAVQTESDGRYSIKANKGDVLQFSFLGMQTKEETVGTASVINVALKDDNTNLNEVVVVGYGTQKKANLTGAVSTVNVAQTFESKPLSDPTKALQGTVPGLTITYGNGGLTSAPKINIRGIGSINGSSSPLILVDNVETSDLSIINPNDIESVSVLKDAASTSIYGARAAFGVVLIKTKTGKRNEQTSVSYSNNFSWNKATVLPDFSDPVPELTGLIEASKRAGTTTPELFGMEMETLKAGIANWQQKYQATNTGKEMILGQDFDYVGGRVYFFKVWDPKKEMLNNYTNQNNHNLTIRGGSEKVGYYLSSGYSNEGGIFKLNPDEVNKYNITASVNATVTNWLDVDAKMLFRNFRYDYPMSYYSTGDWYYFWRWGSYFPYGTYNGNYFRHLPAYQAGAQNSNLSSNYNRIDLGATIKLTKDLNIRADYTIGRDNALRHVVGGKIMAYDFWTAGTPPLLTDVSTATQDMVRYASSRALVNTLNAFATYTKTFKNDHNLKLMGGANVDSYDSFGLTAEKRKLLDPAMGEINLATGDQFASGTRARYAYTGFFSRINYDYKGIYLLELNGRYDGASSFSKKDRWGFFPSGSLGYRLSEEKFMQFSKKYIDDLKLRASYGQLGNQDVGGQYYLETMANDKASWISGNVLAPTINPPIAVANSLTWERVKMLDLGVDVRFLKDHIGVTFDWYERNTTGMLTSTSVPATFGTGGPRVNGGNLRTRGFEISIDGRYNVTKDLKLNATLSLNDSRSIITEWDNPSMLLSQNYKGKELGEIWGFETEGYFTSAEDVAASPSQVALQNGNFVYGPGDIKYKNQNGDNKIDGGKMTLSDHGDLVKLGNTNPRYQYSARLGGTYKGFDFDVYLQGVGKRDFWGLGNVAIPLYQGADILYAHQLDYWTPENPNAFYPRPYVGNNATKIAGLPTSGNNYYVQSKYMIDMAYLRLKNVTVGYTFKNDFLNKYKIKSFRLYVSGQNLAEFKNSKLPLDPEITDGDNGFLGRTFPFARMYSFGLNLNF